MNRSLHETEFQMLTDRTEWLWADIKTLRDQISILNELAQLQATTIAILILQVRKLQKKGGETK